ncbi:CPBP family intramembrane glutamic endopeptidase [Allonocardiopsis opalescens]|uniref:CAAX prenyl protease 2/Lysostaphin resistance protein A-like domain-containing protein n=1 Tax=Allonocardiopsis opalescens TaxID=1144618 RepID=A0A2T0PSL8_9ACTN|nr:CPBP family intramembrane glutamic endopeptidase [Allonocardiopsis opalescens]PRX91736.1 hypothetical protein CLV72_11418 [Allonocardiopsis opalescens]
MLFSKKNPFVRSGAAGRRTTHPLLALVLVSVIYAIGTVLGTLLITPFAMLFPEEPTGHPAFAMRLVFTVLQHAPIFVLLWLWLRFYERRGFGTLGLRLERGAWSRHALGFGIGLAFVLGWLGLQFLLGNLRLERWVQVPDAAAALLLVWIPVMYLNRLIMIAIEEILFRGWLLQTTAVRWGVPAAVAFSSAGFALFHFVNPLSLLFGTAHHFHWALAANLLLWSVLAALLTLAGRSLWAAVALHAVPLWFTTWGLVSFESPLAVAWFSHPHASRLLGGEGNAGPFEGYPATILLALAVAVTALVLWRRAARTEVGPADPAPEDADARASV